MPDVCARDADINMQVKSLLVALQLHSSIALRSKTASQVHKKGSLAYAFMGAGGAATRITSSSAENQTATGRKHSTIATTVEKGIEWFLEALSFNLV